MEIVSGRTGKPHVTSQQFRQFIEGTVGQDSYILRSGEKLEPQLASNNSLKIRSGMMCHHGNISSVKIGTYDEVELTNGTQGMKRIDLVVNRYTRNEEDNTEKNEWVVIMGTPAESNPAVPEYIKGNLQNGDLVDDCPVFEVHFDGINIVEVTKKLEIAQTNKDLADRLDKDYILAYGTWYANGTVIPLNDSYLNYRDIIIRTGWNNQNGGIRDHRLSIQKNGTTIYEIVPIYQATKYIGVLVVEFNPNTPNQIKIVQSTGITSASATTGIRNVMGRTKLS